MNNIRNWYLDNIVLFKPTALDCQMAGITTPAVITGPSDVGGVVKNLGTTNINEVSVSWKSYSGIIRDSVFTGLDLGLLDSHEFDFEGMWASPLGTHQMMMWINSVNGVTDDNTANDTVTKNISYTYEFPAKPAYEEFTSSTCGPCASFNASFVPWSQTHADEITLVKYQMNWPGNGDPYYTAEGGTRRSAYGVNAVPQLFCNGTDIGASTGAAQAALTASHGIMMKTHNI